MIISFDEIAGQKPALEAIKLSLERGRLTHAILLEGAEGIGKLSLSQALAARFLCREPREDQNACGVCKSCVMLKSGSHPDYLELPRDCRELRIRRFTEREGGTEDITHEPVLTFMRLKPLMQQGKVCVIPDAQRMNSESANAFLKTLEEPPAGSLIILTATSREQLLSTIVSRCRRIGMAGLTEEDVVRVLLGKGLEDSAARKLCEICEGSPGKALELSGEQAVENWNWLGDAFDELTPAGAVALGEQMSRRIKAGKSGEDKRKIAQEIFDLAALKLRRGVRRGMSARGCSRALEALWSAGERLQANVRPDLVVYNVSLELISALKRG